MIIKKTLVIVAVVSFCAGMGVSWLILNQRESGTQKPPTYLVKQTSSAIESPVVPGVLPASPGAAAVIQGDASYDQKNWVKAIELYQQAIALGTDNADVRTDLGNALRFAGEPRKALEQYQIAQRKDPQHENSLYNMAMLYAQELHDPAAASRAMKEYLLRFPNGDKASVAKEIVGKSELP